MNSKLGAHAINATNKKKTTEKRLAGQSCYIVHQPQRTAASSHNLINLRAMTLFTIFRCICFDGFPMPFAALECTNLC